MCSTERETMAITAAAGAGAAGAAGAWRMSWSRAFFFSSSSFLTTKSRLVLHPSTSIIRLTSSPASSSPLRLFSTSVLARMSANQIPKKPKLSEQPGIAKDSFRSESDTMGKVAPPLHLLLPSPPAPSVRWTKDTHPNMISSP